MIEVLEEAIIKMLADTLQPPARELASSRNCRQPWRRLPVATVTLARCKNPGQLTS